MRVERTIDARPSDDELSAILRDIARAFGMQPKGRGRLSGGTLFTADANGTTIDNAVATANGAVGSLHVTAFSGFSD